MIKPFIYCDSLEVFNNLRIAYDSSNLTYAKNNIQMFGTPDILWEHIVFIDKENIMWTHGKFYGCLDNYYSKQEIDDKIANIENIIEKILEPEPEPQPKK